MYHKTAFFVCLSTVFAPEILAQSGGSAVVTYLSGPNFCTAAFGYTVPAFCTAPGELPMGSFPVPPIGGFYVDPNFGAKVRLLTDGTTNSLHQYSTPSAFSATGKYALLTRMDGHTRIIDVATAAIVAPDVSGLVDYPDALWSATDDDIVYTIGANNSPTMIKKYQISTGKSTTLIDYATDGHHFTEIGFGGTGDLSADNWAAFFAEKEHQVCAVDLNQLKTYCADYTAANPGSRVGWSLIDYVLISKGKDVDSNRRYVLLMGNPAFGAFSVNEQTGVLDFEYRGPEFPAGFMGGDTAGVGNKDGICDPGEVCLGAPHADVFADNGRQYLLVDSGIDSPTCEDDLVSLQLSKGVLNLLKPVESGGGRKVLFTLYKCSLTWSDLHFGCARSATAFCAISTDYAEPNLPTQIRDGKTPFDSEIIVMRGNGVELRRLAMHRSVQTQYWDQPRACISPDGSMVLWDSNFGNPANHRVALAETGFGTTTLPPGCTYTLSATSLDVGAAATSGMITVTPSSVTCGAPTASSNVSWATASASGNTVTWSVTANGGSQSRIGTFNIAGQTVTIVQAGVSPALTMALTPSSITLGTAGGLPSAAQTVNLTFAGGAALNWTATPSQPNIFVTPVSGIGNGTLQISATAGQSGFVTVSAVGAANSPQMVQVQVTSNAVTLPFGSFDTPTDSSKGLSAAVAVTGWALDAVGVTKVDIWREPVASEPAGLVYIGDAVFVTGARPDVAKAYSRYPFANRAGWGYLLLTNFLPNNGGAKGPGNGTYKLHALAHNQAGAVVDLGVKTITVDNASATQPFGSIDTPAQGATVSGNQYLNFGWALTPMPGIIPTDGSTITVSVDGVTLGHPTYNQFRNDIAGSFPGLANSNGAIGFLYIDTTKLTDGVHTIGWGVWDNKVRGAGIGSRFFSVQNGTGPANDPMSTASLSEEVLASAKPQSSAAFEPASLSKGEALVLDVQEMDRIEVALGATSGYMVTDGERQSLPVGSTIKGGVFYWQLAPAFLGEYNLVFHRPGIAATRLRVQVHPKNYSNAEVQSAQ
jgi:hypothetical protein